jgi:4-hydroxybenzoate polyprenyltransferase
MGRSIGEEPVRGDGGSRLNPVIRSLLLWGETVKFSHTVFAMPFAMIAAFLAARETPQGRPSIAHFILVVMCMISARTAAMTFNRIVDADLDARNPRTAGRPIPSGRLHRAAAWWMLGISALTFGMACTGFYLLFGNTWPVLLSGPVLLYLCGYSLTKRFTRWSHLYLGSAVALSPVAAWLAIHPASLGWTAFLLMGAVTCWIAGFDIIYSCQDIEIDRRDGLNSLPSRAGPAAALWIARWLHVLTIAGLIGVGVTAKLGNMYYAGVVVVAILLLVENLLVRPGHYERVNAAFFTCNGIVSLVLATAAIIDMFV